jgi:hypothetical protein
MPARPLPSGAAARLWSHGAAGGLQAFTLRGGSRGRVGDVRTSFWLAPLLISSCASASGVRTAPSAPVAPVAVPSDSAGREPPLVLQPGDVAELPVAADGRARALLATPGGGERFVVIVASTRFDSQAPPAHYSVALDSVAADSVALGSGAVAPAARTVDGCALSEEAWRSVAVSSDAAPTGPGPLVGARRELALMTRGAAATIGSEVVSVGEHTAVLRDTTHPTSLDAAFAEQFRVDFERVILPRARQVFGTESDIDHDGRIELVFSRLTQEHGVAFFSACDLASLEGCPASNHGEYLYLTPPDAIDPPYNTANAIKEILTHELGHLLHFHRKVLVNELSAWSDSVYASEGIGGLAQDVVGYQAGNLYVAKAGLDGIDNFSLADVLDRRRRSGAVDGVSRGGAYLFFRYLYDRAGGDEALGLDIRSRGGPAFLRALLDAREPVVEALPRVAAASLSDLAMDFFTALAVSNRELLGLSAAKNPCFSYRPTVKDPVTDKQRGTSLFASFHGIRMDGPHGVAASDADGRLLAGGVEYLTVDAVPSRAQLGLSVAVDADAAPRVRIARWK